jgi:hypothetical protein
MSRDRKAQAAISGQFRRAGLAVLLAVAGAAGGCATVRTAGDVSIVGGKVHLRGVELPHRRTVRLRGDVVWARVGFDVPGEVALTGRDDRKADIELTLYERRGGDVDVVLGATGVSASSRGGEPFVIFSVCGCIPRLPLDLRSGLGAIRVDGFSGVAHIAAKAGSGRIEVRSISGVATLCLEAGSGDVAAADVTDVADLRVRTGSGDVRVEGVRQIGTAELSAGTGRVTVGEFEGVRALEVDAGSGDVAIRGLRRCASAQVRTGSGSIRLTGSEIGRADLASRSGGLVLCDTTARDLRCTTATGDIRLKGVAYGRGRLNAGAGSVRHDR